MAGKHGRNCRIEHWQIRPTGEMEFHVFARDVLARILESVSDRLTWYLLYDPGGKFGYALNISTVATRGGAEASTEDRSAESPTDAVPTSPVVIRQ